MVPYMPALLKDRGSCPVCGIEVPRIVTNAVGRMHEIYACPDHGAVSYGGGELSVQEWTRRCGPKNVSSVVGPTWASTLQSVGVGHLAARN